MSEGTSHNHAKRRRTLWVVAAGLAIVVFAVTASFLFVQSKDKSNESSRQAGQVASDQIVAKVGELFELPKNETPTVAQVQDKTKLAGQQFFANAENEDYILVYTQAKVALLYREKTNKLVNVGPVNIDGQGVAGESTQKSGQ